MKIALITSFNSFDVGYSLTGIVKSQIKMLQKYGNHVELFVMERFKDTDFEMEYSDLKINKVLPFFHMTDYKSLSEITSDHKKMAVKTFDALKDLIPKFDVVFEHDMCFQGWHVPLGLGILSVSELNPKIPFMHWVHSIPTGFKDIWDSSGWSPNNFIVYPNKSERLIVSENYRTMPEKIRVIPHILDIREFSDFSRESKDFIDTYPMSMNANIVQVYPASTDKLTWKKVDRVIQIFGEFKKMGNSVCLIVANQFATTKRPKENVVEFNKIAENEGLEVGKEFIFTSDFQPPKYEYGISKRFVRELMSLSNLFIFPTMGESFGLIVPEISLTSGALLVCNRSLQQQVELTGGKAVYLDFGSHSINHTGVPDMYAQYANIIMSALSSDFAVMTRTMIRKTYNMDNLYKKYYLPVCMELINNCKKYIKIIDVPKEKVVPIK